MKHVLLITLFVLLTSFGWQKAYAETSVTIENNSEGASSDVHVENSTGQSTVCVNGNCSTTQNGGGSATVCINGKCDTSQDGNIEKDEGGAKVSVQQNSQYQAPKATPTFTPQSSPSATQHPEKKVHSADSGHEASGSAKKSFDKAQDKSSGQGQFGIEEMMNNIRNFFSDLFSQNK